MANEISLTEDVVELTEYFRELGYAVGIDFQPLFFSLYARLPEEEKAVRGSIVDFEDLLAPLLAKTADEVGRFHGDFIAFVKRKKIISETDAKEEQKKLQQQAAYRQSLEQLRKNEKKKQASLQKMLQKLLESQKPQADLEIPKNLEKNFGLLAKIAHSSKERFREIAAGAKSKAEAVSNEQLLKKALEGAVSLNDKDFKTANTTIQKLAKINQESLKLLRNSKGQSLERLEQELATSRRMLENYEKQLAQMPEEMELDTITIKPASISHRNVFLGGGSVQITEEVLVKDFTNLKKEDLKDLRYYLRLHAQQFRTRVARNVRTSAKRAIDLSATCKKSCVTGGVPVSLRFVKPRMQKTKLVLFLDVSGSCKNASAVMLQFLQTMMEVFPGGCKCYCFVNRLYDVTEPLLEYSDVSEVLAKIPTRGVYSDYYRPLQQLTKEHLPEVTKDTILIFIGDARNNSNPTGEELMKNISRRARAAYWINTETKDQWDINDSIMGIYSRYMKLVGEVLNPAQLIEFMLQVK